MPRPVLAVVVVATALLLAGCTDGDPMPTPSPTKPSASGDGVLRIGTVFSTTGPAAADAASQTAAVNAAVRELDAAGGVNGAPVEVINRNGGSAGDGLAEAAFADLVARGADAVIGPSSSDLAAVLAPLAAAARIPLISASATGDRPAATGAWYLRSIPSDTQQTEALAAMLAATLPADAAVAVLRSGDAAEAADIAADDPDAVVIATADTGEQTQAAVLALIAAGIDPDRLWFAGSSLGGYPAVGAALEGAHGTSAGVPADPALAARVLQEDPGVPSVRYATEAYDAVVLVALAAIIAGDDGGASIAASLRSVADAGIPCTSFGACLDVLTTQTDIDYTGPSGAFSWNDDGDRVGALYARYVYDATGSPVPE